jgi:LUC7 N_terminus
MGKERDVPLDERTGKGLKFSDPEVCKYELCGLCPYRLFKNTKSDLGEPSVWTALLLAAHLYTHLLTGRLQHGMRASRALQV